MVSTLCFSLFDNLDRVEATDRLKVHLLEKQVELFSIVFDVAHDVFRQVQLKHKRERQVQLKHKLERQVQLKHKHEHQVQLKQA